MIAPSRLRTPAFPAMSLRASQVGIAIGAECVTVASHGNGELSSGTDSWSWRLPINLLDAGADEATAVLREALSACPYLSRQHSSSAHVVILPPLALARRLSLPRLSAVEYRQVLSRDAFRYFPTDRGERIVGVFRGRGSQASPSPVFAASTSAKLVTAVQQALSDVGCSLMSLDCAYAAWVAAAHAIWPATRRAASAIITGNNQGTEIILAEGDGPRLVRRLGRDASPEQFLDAIGVYSSVGPVRACAFFGLADCNEHWQSLLLEAGVAVMAPTPVSRRTADDIAAAFAAVGAGPGLYNEQMYAAARASSQRLAVTLGGAACATVVVAAAVLLWSAKRELATVLDERTAIKPAVEQALALRSSLGAIDSRVATIARLRDGSPRWSAVLSSVAQLLPDDAHITSMQARGDSVTLEGDAARAGDVFEALRNDPDIASVHSTAPVRQQLQQGASVEHFTVAAHVAPQQAGQGSR